MLRKSMEMIPGLYIVSTPIGNLNDITLRAIEVLSRSDFIYCEDTRISNRLLVKHGIKAKLRIYNDQSTQVECVTIKELIIAGKVISLITDAGTPLISDPGYKLVKYLKQENLTVDVIPGPCAAIAAITLSGIPTNSFLFTGFLPKTIHSKRELFQHLSRIDYSLIFYDTAPRLLSSLLIAQEILGDRVANVARELTKMYQESKTAKLSELIEYYKQNKIKGEIVLTISKPLAQQLPVLCLREEIKSQLQQGVTAKSLVHDLFVKYQDQLNKKELYQLINQVKGESEC